MELEHNFKEAPNVVSEDGCRVLINQGWAIEVICLESAAKRHSNYFGKWGVRVVSPDGSVERMLVTARKVMELRVFKTITGLISFLDDFDVSGPRIPLYEGMRLIQEVSKPPSPARN